MATSNFGAQKTRARFACRKGLKARAVPNQDDFFAFVHPAYSVFGVCDGSRAGDGETSAPATTAFSRRERIERREIRVRKRAVRESTQLAGVLLAL